MPYEEDIRAALRARAGQAPDAHRVMTEIWERRTLGASAAPGARRLGLMNHRGRPGPARRRFRVLAVPAAAAAAVTALIIGSLALSGGTHVPRQAAGARVSLRSVPRYYMTLLRIGHPWPDEVLIRDTVTGATVASARPPSPFTTFLLIAAGPNDRTFVVAAQPGNGNGQLPTRLYFARLDPARHLLRLSPLPIAEFPLTEQVESFTVSPNGQQLAVAVATSNGAGGTAYAQIRIYSLAARRDAGPVKVWTGQPSQISDDFFSLTWERSGALAFNDGFGIRVLNTYTRSGNVLSDSRAIRGAGLVTTDGTTTVADTNPANKVKKTKAGSIWSWPGPVFAEYSTATGKLIRTVGPHWPAEVTFSASGPRSDNSSVIWANSSGSVLVVEAPPISGKAGKHPILGVVSGRKFEPIPDSQVNLLAYIGFVF